MILADVLLVLARCAPVFAVVGVFSIAASADTPGSSTGSHSQKTVRDLMWVWGNPGMAEEGAHTAATFAAAGPAERAKILGVPNVIMAGRGLPRDDTEARQLMAGVAHMPRVIWEIEGDPEDGGPPFVYTETIARLGRLADDYAQIEGLLLDDMTSVGIDKGFGPEHIRDVRKLVAGTCPQVKVYGVVYTMNFDRETVDACVEELDAISLWTWHARDIPDLERNVAHCERQFPGTPILLGLYLYDYGEDRRMPLDLLEKQCETALELLHAGRIEGIVFLTIKNDPEAVSWTADWIGKVGGQPVGKPDQSDGSSGE